MARPVLFVLYLALLALVVVLLHLAPGLDRSLVELQMRNGLHVIGFALVAGLTIRMTPGGVWTRTIVALLVAAGIGAMSEFTQKATGSAFDVEDLYRDMGGATMAVIAWMLWVAPAGMALATFGRFVLRSLAILVAGSVFVPFAYWAGVFAAARAEAPVIHDFDQRWAGYFVSSINATHEIVRDADDAHVTATLSRRPRSGVAFAVAARDWRAAGDLVFDAWTTHEEPTTLTIHINGRNQIGRFRDSAAGTVVVDRTPRTYRVSIAEVLAETQAPDDIGNIRQLVLLARDRTEGAVLSVDDIRLE